MAEKQKEKKEYSNQEAREVMTEVKTGRRLFETKKGLVQVRFPKVEENRLADWEYSKVLIEAAKDSIPTNKQMTKMIEEYGLWTKEDDDKIASLQVEIDKQIVILGKLTEGSKNYEKAEDTINELRQQIITIQSEKNKLFQNTAESKADEAKMSFLIYKCTEYAEDNMPLWETYKDFKNEGDQEMVNQIVYQFLTFIHGIPVDLLEEPPVSENEKVEKPTETE
jgi:hypothetical protein